MALKFEMKSKEEADIFIDTDINSLFGFTASDLRVQLQKLSPTAAIRVFIDSEGGDVFEGLNIYNLLRAHKGHVTTITNSLAASISSVIFLAGDDRIIADNAMIMVHDPKASARNQTKENLESLLDLLEKSTETIRNIYANRTGSSLEVVDTWLKGDTWFTASESLETGFATEVISLDQAVASVSLVKLVAKLQQTGVNVMFETWLAEQCEILGMDVSKVTSEQRTKLEAQYKGSLPTPPPRKTEPIIENDDEVKIQAKLDARQREKAADEEDRQQDIHAAAVGFNDEDLNQEYLKTIQCRRKTVRGVVSYAIKNNWSADRFELEMRRAQREDIGHVGIHTKESLMEGFGNPLAISCALVRNAKVTSSATHKFTGEQYGYEHAYKEEILEASEHPDLRNMGLQQLLEHHIIAATGSRYRGRTNTDGFIEAVRQAQWSLRASGNTTWTGLNIFDDAANKILWASYESQNTTWQAWVKQSPVSDFKTHNTYRLTNKGGYQKVGPDGALKHGGFTDDKFTHSAETYGKIVGLARADIINDDLGALSGVMTALGEEGAKFLEELFYVHLQGQLSTLFTAGNNNFLDGVTSDLGVDGISLAENLLSDHVDADNSPIMAEASLLLHGTQDTVLAQELFNQVTLSGLQTANQKKRPDQNPHVGKYTPIKAVYLSNTNIKQRITGLGEAIPAQTTDQWLLLRPPSASGGIVIGSFLNGNVRPTVESGDPTFDVLGLQWRAFHDAGADNGDSKWGVHMAGA